MAMRSESFHRIPDHSEFRKGAAIAKWGAACAPCATAKAKCIRSNSMPGSKCDRCDRLYKDCSDQVHRPRKKRQSKPSRTAQIEERLNGLVNLLRASGEIPTLHHDLSADTSCIPAESDPPPWNQQQPSLAPGGDELPPDDYASDPKGADGLSAGLGGQGLLSGGGRIPETYNSYAPPTCICRPARDDAASTAPPDSDDNLLAIYQTELAPVLPFVMVPAHVTAAHLAATRPFLMSAIRMCASFTSMKSMRAQMYRLVTHLADHLLLRAERSLDLLAGVIVILGWYHYHCLMHAQLHSLLQLAVCLVGELGLHRAPGLQERQQIMVLQPAEPRSRTNEERRLLLGVWYLSSGISIIFQKTDSMRYSKYMQQCAAELDDAKEYETDALLLTYVRVQHLMERIARLNAPEESDDDAGGIPRAPALAYRTAFRAELDKIRAGLPKHLRTNKFLQVHINTVTLRLYEPPVVDAALLRRLADSMTNLGPDTSSALDIFYQSSAALKGWFDAWLDLPASTYYALAMPTFCQLIYAMTMVGRWAKYAAPQFAARQRQRAGLRSAAATASLSSLYGGAPSVAAASRRGSSLSLPHDPSANNPNVILAGEDARLSRSPVPPPPSTTMTPSASSATAASSAGSPASVPVPQQGGPVYMLRTGDNADPDLPAAVRALRAQLAAQPNLVLDIPEMLRAVERRAEEANAAMVQMAVEPGAWDNSIWGLGIAKIRITLAKLEQFAELVAAVRHGPRGDDDGENDEEEDGEGDEESGSDDADTEMGGQAGPGNMVGWSQLGPSGQQPGIGTGISENWVCTTQWSNDLFEGMDPALWLDGSGDWGSIILSGVGNGGAG